MYRIQILFHKVGHFNLILGIQQPEFTNNYNDIGKVPSEFLQRIPSEAIDYEPPPMFGQNYEDGGYSYQPNYINNQIIQSNSDQNPNISFVNQENIASTNVNIELPRLDNINIQNPLSNNQNNNIIGPIPIEVQSNLPINGEIQRSYVQNLDN